MTDTTDLIEKLRKRKITKLPAGWQKGLKCPECGCNADRPKCMFELGPTCPRHDPDNYEPDPHVESPDPLCQEAADALAAMEGKDTSGGDDWTQIKRMEAPKAAPFTTEPHSWKDRPRPEDAARIAELIVERDRARHERDSARAAILDTTLRRAEAEISCALLERDTARRERDEAIAAWKNAISRCRWFSSGPDVGCRRALGEPCDCLAESNLIRTIERKTK